MNFLRRWAKATLKPKPLWYWVLVRGSLFGLMLMILFLAGHIIFDARTSPEGINFHTLIKAAQINLANTKDLFENLQICLTSGFLCGLLMWVTDYKRSGKIHK